MGIFDWLRGESSEPPAEEPVRDSNYQTRLTVASAQEFVLAHQRQTPRRLFEMLPVGIDPISRVIREVGESILREEYAFSPWRKIDIHSQLDYDRLAGILDELEWHKFAIERYDNADRRFIILIEELKGLFLPFVSALAEGQPDALAPQGPLISLLKEPKEAVERVHNIVRAVSGGAFHNLWGSIWLNDLMIKYKTKSSPRMSLEEWVSFHLSDTILAKLFWMTVHLRIDQEDRLNHTHILAGSGGGKTTLMEAMIARDLEHDRQTGTRTSIIVIDPHSSLIRTVSRVAPAALGDRRVIIIDPRDMEYPPAVNLFAMHERRQSAYSLAGREQALSQVISTFTYFFRGLMGVELTAKQGILFRYLTRFLLTFPTTMDRTAVIADMITLLTDPTPFMKAIRSLPEQQKNFMLDFAGTRNQWTDTKKEIRYRVDAILENPFLANFFSSPENKLDLFTELNEGSLIIIDTAKEFLTDSSPIFGRLWISLIIKALLERAPIPEEERSPAFLYIDEAASYFDDNIDSLLTDMRKFRCGVVLAHHYLGQATSELRSSIAASTLIKYASRVEPEDAGVLAPQMRTTSEFILEQPKHHFAVYCAGKTPCAFSVKPPFGVLRTSEMRITDAQYQIRVDESRRRVSFGPGGTEPSPQAPEKDISSEW